MGGRETVKERERDKESTEQRLFVSHGKSQAKQYASQISTGIRVCKSNNYEAIRTKKTKFSSISYSRCCCKNEIPLPGRDNQQQATKGQKKNNTQLSHTNQSGPRGTHTSSDAQYRKAQTSHFHTIQRCTGRTEFTSYPMQLK